MLLYNLLCLAFATSSFLMGGLPGDTVLPSAWDPSFTIRYQYSGSMDGSSVSLYFTHDSCTYEALYQQEGYRNIKFVLTEDDRKKILKELKELKAGSIKAGLQPIAAVYDGWTETLCLGAHCISGGAGIKLSDKDRELFTKVCTYLQGFALEKGGPGKQSGPEDEMKH